ncbi:hypothetical protein [Burkholderia ubonensis]|uniref:hypothetical protein n=1 Tax=Burkholderia ubonensis TaxID=101571 RepID=UPI000A8A165D|nr:hypothetical protein [Burkholderia ubonensis]
MDDGVNRAGLPSGKKDNISKAGLCGFGRRSRSRLSRFSGFKFNIYLKKARPATGSNSLSRRPFEWTALSDVDSATDVPRPMT